MADTVTGTTATASVQQAAIATLVQRNLIAKSTLLGTITDFSMLAEPGNKTVDIPKVGNFTVTKKTSGTAVDATALTYATDQLALDQQAVVQWLVEKRASKQSRIALAEINLSRAIDAHAKQVDTDIHAALIAGVSSSSPDHIIAFANAASFDKPDVIEGRRLLDMQEVPAGDRFIAVNPTDEASLLGIAGFVEADKYGSNSAVMNGELGRLYGSTVIKSTVVTSGRPLMYHREACCIAFQQDPEFDNQKDLANLAMRYSLDQLYGVKVLQAGKLIVRFGSAT